MGVAYAYPDNEDGTYQDLLTPTYYQAAAGAPFRETANTFVHYARLEVFHHPLEDPTGRNARLQAARVGCVWRGQGTDGRRRASPGYRYQGGRRRDKRCAVRRPRRGGHDLRDADKYRHYLAITKTVEDDSHQAIGKIVTIYGHIDLDLDEGGGLTMNGQTVARGDLVSRHLYSGTVGGPHLHFEIRYYRAGEVGTEGYYGIAVNPAYTEPSAGPWTYGYWDPDVGYGFADPHNQGLFLPPTRAAASWLVR